MTFGRQKRLLLGALAFLAPIPLPFNDILEWPALVVYLALVALFLRRAWNDPPRWLPLWGMNVLGLAYLPFFVYDLMVLGRGRLVLPVVHLGLFALLVKLYSLTRERDKWQAAMGIFFVFLASMGTSVHPSIVLYLALFVGVGLALLTRFALLHVLAGFGRVEPELARLPLGGFLAASTLATLLFAVPLFALLPRVRSPYIVGRGGGTGTVLEAAGFSDAVTLDSIGLIRDRQGVAMRLQGATALDPGHELRFKAATYDLYRGGSWRKSPVRGSLPRGRRARFRLAAAPVASWEKIWLQPLRSRSLPLPVEATVVEPRVPSLDVDRGGAVSLAFSPMEVMEYKVGLADRPLATAEVPRLDGLAPEETLDTAGVSPRMAELARRVMGEGAGAERARRLETHLIQSYEYTQDFVGRKPSGQPLDDFLFKYRSGHCEYFASAMVLMLRSQGIPARLVTGFLGGEYNPFEGYTIVRDGNAHAWVEAYVPESGWQTFDPTPPAGRPAEASEGGWSILRQAYDYLLFRWDRYVLTFGLYDQLRIVGDLHRWWRSFRHLFGRGDATPEPSSFILPGGVEETAPQAVSSPAGRGSKIALALLLALFALVAWRLLLRYRPPLTATAAYRRLRRRLGRPSGRGEAALPALPNSLPPLAFRREAARRFPLAAAPAGRIVDLYLRESFGGVELKEEERRVLKADLEEAERGMKTAASA